MQLHVTTLLYTVDVDAMRDGFTDTPDGKFD